MKNDQLVDPYSAPLYQATLIKQKKDMFFTTNIDNEEIVSFSQIQVEIFLVNGGVNVEYNSKFINFVKKDDEIEFSREINAFFIRKGFHLESVLYTLSVYKCGTKKDGTSSEFVFKADEALLDNSETDELNMIISRMLRKSISK